MQTTEGRSLQKYPIALAYFPSCGFKNKFMIILIEMLFVRSIHTIIFHESPHGIGHFGQISLPTIIRTQNKTNWAIGRGEERDKGQLQRKQTKNVCDSKLTGFGKCSKPLIEHFFRQSLSTRFDASLIILNKMVSPLWKPHKCTLFSFRFYSW